MQAGFDGGNRQGQGSGLGMGRGLGLGRGMGKGNGMIVRLLETPEQEIAVLTQTASCLKQDLDQVNSRIEALKKQQEEATKSQ